MTSWISWLICHERWWATKSREHSPPGWMSSCLMSFLVSLWTCSVKKLNTVQFVLNLLTQSRPQVELWQKSVEKVFVKVYCQKNHFQSKNLWLLLIVIFPKTLVGAERAGSRNSKRMGIGREMQNANFSHSLGLGSNIQTLSKTRTQNVIWLVSIFNFDTSGPISKQTFALRLKNLG